MILKSFFDYQWLQQQWTDCHSYSIATTYGDQNGSSADFGLDAVSKKQPLEFSKTMSEDGFIQTKTSVQSFKTKINEILNFAVSTKSMGWNVWLN